MAKVKQWLVILLCAVPFLLAAVVAVAMHGNPVSHLLARYGVREYLSREYPGNDFEIGREGYNFKDGNYYAHVASRSSVDTHFTVYLDGFGRVSRDSYDSVLDGWNTRSRMNNGYDDLVDLVFLDRGVPYLEEGFFGGSLLMRSESGRDGAPEGEYGLEDWEIVVDKEYDLRTLGRRAGHLYFYVRQEDVSVKAAAEILLDIRARMDQGGVGFYGIDLVLTKPRREDGTAADDVRVNISHFRYEDIVPEGLEERVQRAHEALEEYYTQQDARNQEIMK